MSVDNHTLIGLGSVPNVTFVVGRALLPVFMAGRALLPVGVLSKMQKIAGRSARATEFWDRNLVSGPPLDRSHWQMPALRLALTSETRLNLDP